MGNDRHNGGIRVGTGSVFPAPPRAQIKGEPSNWRREGFGGYQCLTNGERSGAERGFTNRRKKNGKRSRP